MYKRFFGLRHNPFNVNPDPRFLFHTKATEEALACLAYGIQKRQGFILLTGEVGTGKTTLINELIGWLRKEGVPSAFIFNPQLSPQEFLEFMMVDFGIPCPSTEKSRILIRLNEWLLERHGAGQTAVVVVDEAQAASDDVLEEIRLLTNLETSTEKLLQIVLSGQPEFEDRLRHSRLRQLRQRITLWSRMRPLTPEETQAYILERLRIAGSDGQAIFAPEAFRRVYEYSHGIPRVINLLCGNALISAYADQERPVAARTIEQVARQFELDRVEPAVDSSSRPPGPGVGLEATPSPHHAAASAAASARNVGFVLRRSMDKTPGSVFPKPRALDGGEEGKLNRNLVPGSVPGPSLASVERPKAAVDPSPASASEPVPTREQRSAAVPTPLPMRPPPARSPSPVLVDPAKPRAAVNLIPSAGPRKANPGSILWFLAVLAMGAALGGILQLRRLRQHLQPVAPSLEAGIKAEETPGSKPASLGDARAPSLSRTPIATTNASPALGPGRLVVRANVEGARISIDGRSDPAWVSPHTFPVLAAGTHLVTLSKEGFEPVELPSTVRPGGTSSIDARLERPSGVINIVTNPPQLEILIDGHPFPPTPVQAKMEVGQHTYTIRRPGFQDYAGKFTLEKGSVVTRRVDFGGSR